MNNKINILKIFNKEYFSDYTDSPYIDSIIYTKLKAVAYILLFSLISIIFTIIFTFIDIINIKIMFKFLILFSIIILCCYSYIYMKLSVIIKLLSINHVDFNLGSVFKYNKNKYIFMNSDKFEELVNDIDLNINHNLTHSDYIIVTVKPNSKINKMVIVPNVFQLNIKCILYTTNDYYNELKRRSIK